MLPDPYVLARRNSYKWTAEYIDTQEEDAITFDTMVGISSFLHEDNKVFLTGGPPHAGQDEGAVSRREHAGGDEERSGGE